jgi:hypothetical protein
VAEEEKEEEEEEVIPPEPYVEREPKKWVRNPKFTKPVHDEEK